MAAVPKFLAILRSEAPKIIVPEIFSKFAQNFPKNFSAIFPKISRNSLFRSRRSTLTHLFGSECSISWTFLDMMAAASKFFATLCSKAVVELVLNNPKALLLIPWDRHASTAAAQTTSNYRILSIDVEIDKNNGRN